MECPICFAQMDRAKREDGEWFLLCEKCDYETHDLGKGLPVDDPVEPQKNERTPPVSGLRHHYR